MRWLHALAGLLVLCAASGQNCVPSGCTSGTVDYGYVQADISGDHFYLGGMFEVHGPGDSAYECGDIQKSGLEALEAFLWTIRHFRETYDILSDIEVGALGFDSCGRPEKALQQLMNLENCVIGFGDFPIEPKLVLGYVGPGDDVVAIQMASVTSDMKKTLVSHGAASPLLSGEFPYFLRMLPSDLEQSDILAGSVTALGWNYTQLVYSDDEYGQVMRDRFVAQSQTLGICVVNEQSINPSSLSSDLLGTVDSLVAHSDTRAVVVLAPSRSIRELLGAVDQGGARGLFTWMAPTVWGNNEDLVAGLEQVAEGAFTLAYQQQAPGLDIFQDYIAGVTPGMVEDNPWFKEYWMSVFECNLPGKGAIYSEDCDTDTQRLDPAALDPLVPYVIRATGALLNGIEQAQASQCVSSGLCDNFINHANRWDVIHDHVRLLNMSDVAVFQPATGDSLSTNYELLNYRGPNVGCSQHCFAEVGVYETASGWLQFSSPLYFYDQSGVRFTDATSVCQSSPCIVCGEELVTTASTARPSGEGSEASEDVNEVVMRDAMWAMVLLILAGLGVLLVLAFEVFLLTQICGSNYLASWHSMWLGQLLLLAVLLSYLSLFAFIPSPSLVSCTIIRVAVGTSYAMIFAVLLVKLMIILSSKSYGSLQGIYQVLMFCFAWGIQIVIDIEWLILRPPEVIHDPDQGWQCKTHFLDQVQSLVYVMFLIVITTIIAIKTHGIFSNFREGVFIGLTAGFTIPIFIAWVLLGALNSNTDFQEPAMAYGLFLTATLVFLVMFLPKVRQLNSLGVEGSYKEDARRSSVGVPSVRALGSGLGVASNSVLSGSVLLYSPPSNSNSRPNSGQLSNGGLLVDTTSRYHTLRNDPNIQFDSHTIQTSRHGNINSLFLRHPGGPGSNKAISVKSMPITSHQQQQMEQNPNGTTSRVLRVTGDLSGRSYAASVGIKRKPAHGPIPKFGTTRSNRSSTEARRSITDLGSL